MCELHIQFIAKVGLNLPMYGDHFSTPSYGWSPLLLNLNIPKNNCSPNYENYPQQ